MHYAIKRQRTISIRRRKLLQMTCNHASEHQAGRFLPLAAETDERREARERRDPEGAGWQERGGVGATAQALEAPKATEETFQARTNLRAARDLAARNRGEVRDLFKAIQGSRPTCSACNGMKLEKSPALAPKGK